jgi:hypothetical protein
MNILLAVTIFVLYAVHLSDLYVITLFVLYGIIISITVIINGVKAIIRGIIGIRANQQHSIATLVRGIVSFVLLYVIIEILFRIMPIQVTAAILIIQEVVNEFVTAIKEGGGTGING